MKKELVILIVAILIAVGLFVYYSDDVTTDVDTNQPGPGDETASEPVEKSPEDLSAVLPDLPITDEEQETLRVFETDLGEGQTAVNGFYSSQQSLEALSSTYESYLTAQGYTIEDSGNQGDLVFYYGVADDSEVSVSVQSVESGAEDGATERLVNLSYHIGLTTQSQAETENGESN